MATAPSRVGCSPVVTLLLGALVLAPLAQSVAATPDGRQQTGSERSAAGREDADRGTHGSIDVPQAFVVCTGWHALCFAFDCRMNGDRADCDCFRVNETHIVETASIQDAAAKRLTQAQCTDEYPCDVDQAPVCKAMRYGHYKVDDVRYEWVSTYSYRGWCGLLKREPRPCDQQTAGYVGDLYWAICDAAPCVDNQNPPDPDRPLSCRCRVENTPFVGANGSCTGDNGGIMSSFSLFAWDFRNNTYRIPMPGYEYVHGACAPLKSDPWKEPRRE